MEEEKKPEETEQKKEEVTGVTTADNPESTPVETASAEIPNEHETIPANATSSEEERPVVVSMEDGKIGIKTLNIRMSRRFRLGLLCSLLVIVGCSAITTYLVMAKSLPYAPWIIGVLGGLLTLIALCNVIIKLHDWVFTMNVQNQKLGEWAMYDIIYICRDFIAAGVQYAAEEVQKVKGEKGQESAPEEQKS